MSNKSGSVKWHEHNRRHGTVMAHLTGAPRHGNMTRIMLNVDRRNWNGKWLDVLVVEKTSKPVGHDWGEPEEVSTYLLKQRSGTLDEASAFKMQSMPRFDMFLPRAYFDKIIDEVKKLMWDNNFSTDEFKMQRELRVVLLCNAIGVGVL